MDDVIRVKQYSAKRKQQRWVHKNRQGLFERETVEEEETRREKETNNVKILNRFASS